MKINKFLMFCALSSVVFLAACGAENNVNTGTGAQTATTQAALETEATAVTQAPVVTQKDSSQETSLTIESTQAVAETEETAVNNYRELLQGRWRDTSDEKSEIAFTGSLKTDYYEGKEVDKGAYTLEKSCQDQEPSEIEEYVVQGDMCWFIADLNEDSLSLGYVGRGNTLYYVRVAGKNE